MRNWNDWLSIQKRYDKQQVKQLREQLDAKVQKLSAEELLEFQRELDAKLSVLMGQEARDARLWLAESLSAASESYGKKIRESQPDVANMSAAELRESLDEFELRRARTQEATASFQAAQRDRVRSVQAELRLQHEDSQKAMDRAASSQANAQPGYFVPSYTHQHRRSYADRPAFPFFWGGFW